MLFFFLHMYTYIVLIYVTTWKVRSAGNSGSDKTTAMDNDVVELEKSNILMMGPTGSGNLNFHYVQYSDVF